MKTKSKTISIRWHRFLRTSFLLLPIGCIVWFFSGALPTLAIDGLMNGKQITGETDDYLFWLQTYDANTAPFYTDRLFINKAGNVGIGTTNPGTRLSVVGSGNYSIDAGNYRLGNVATPVSSLDAVNKAYLDSAVSTAQSAYWNLSGSNLYASSTAWNVGIGTTAPTQPLTVKTRTGAPYTALEIQSYGTSPQSLFAGAVSNTGLFIGSGYYYNSSNYRTPGTESSIIRFESGIFKIFTDAGLTANTDFIPTERLRVTSSGNVGIGTTAPTYKLDVSGTGRFTQPVIVGAPTDTNHAATKNYVDSTIGGGSGSTVGYWTMNGANISNSNTGNVGIGTTAPGVKLDVSGAIRTNNQLISTIATGTAPIAVNSNTLVTNLNADFWDGYSWEDLQIGARNYYTKTKKPLVVVGTGNSNQVVYGDYPVANGNLQNNGFNVGDRVVLSYKWKATNTGGDWGSGSFYMRFYNGVTWYDIHSNIPVNAANNEGFVETVFTLTDNSVLTQNFYPRLVSIPTNVTLSFSEVKIEKGSKATSWLPAPEDMVLYDANGNVGIGTTTPTYKLDVSGTGRFTQPVIVGAPTVADHAATKSYVRSYWRNIWNNKLHFKIHRSKHNREFTNL